MDSITLAALAERRAALVAQRAAYVEDANRQIAAFDGALALLAELLAQPEQPELIAAHDDNQPAD